MTHVLESGRDWASVAEAQKLVDRSRMQLYRWIKLGYVRTTRTRRHTYLRVGDLLDAEAAFAVGNTPEVRVPPEEGADQGVP